MRSKLSVTLVGLICITFVYVLSKGFGRDPHEVPFMLKGKPAPPFELRGFQAGERVSLSRLKGRPVILNFWSTWCGPCRVEHPVLEWGYRQYGSQVQFLGAVFEDTEENVRNFMREVAFPYPQLIDPRSQMAVDYGVAGVPETYFIDANGIIQDKVVGAIDPDTLAVHVKELLQPLAQAPRR